MTPRPTDPTGTPFIRLGRVEPGGHLWVKAEFLSPTGSAFDRIAGVLLDQAAADTAGPFVVAGGGSHCLAFAAAAAARAVPLVAVCPSSTLGEHRILLGAYPCEVVPSEGGLLAAHDLASSIVSSRGGFLVFGPRAREAAALVFAETVGAELRAHFDELGGSEPAAIVAPIGSGALLEGLGRAFADRAIRPVLLGTVASGGGAGGASLQDGTVARDEAPRFGQSVIEVTDDAAYAMRREVARKEGLLVGLASAGTLHAAVEAIATGQVASAAAIAVDAGDRYFSRDVVLGTAGG